jgi:hypothetical protein
MKAQVDPLEATCHSSDSDITSRQTLQGTNVRSAMERRDWPAGGHEAACRTRNADIVVSETSPGAGCPGKASGIPAVDTGEVACDYSSAGNASLVTIHADDARGSIGTHAEGIATHAEGIATHADLIATHAKGIATLAEGIATHAKWMATHADWIATHADGIATHAKGIATHAEGFATHADGIATYANGIATHAKGIATHAEGIATPAHDLKGGVDLKKVTSVSYKDPATLGATLASGHPAAAALGIPAAETPPTAFFSEESRSVASHGTAQTPLPQQAAMPANVATGVLHAKERPFGLVLDPPKPTEGQQSITGRQDVCHVQGATGTPAQSPLMMYVARQVTKDDAKKLRSHASAPDTTTGYANLRESHASAPDTRSTLAQPRLKSNSKLADNGNLAEPGLSPGIKLTNEAVCAEPGLNPSMMHATEAGKPEPGLNPGMEHAAEAVRPEPGLNPGMKHAAEAGRPEPGLSPSMEHAAQAGLAEPKLNPGMEHAAEAVRPEPRLDPGMKHAAEAGLVEPELNPGMEHAAEAVRPEPGLNGGMMHAAEAVCGEPGLNPGMKDATEAVCSEPGLNPGMEHAAEAVRPEPGLNPGMKHAAEASLAKPELNPGMEHAAEAVRREPGLNPCMKHAAQACRAEPWTHRTRRVPFALWEEVTLVDTPELPDIAPGVSPSFFLPILSHMYNDERGAAAMRLQEAPVIPFAAKAQAREALENLRVKLTAKMFSEYPERWMPVASDYQESSFSKKLRERWQKPDFGKPLKYGLQRLRMRTQRKPPSTMCTPQNDAQMKAGDCSHAVGAVVSPQLWPTGDRGGDGAVAAVAQGHSRDNAVGVLALDEPVLGDTYTGEASGQEQALDKGSRLVEEGPNDVAQYTAVARAANIAQPSQSIHDEAAQHSNGTGGELGNSIGPCLRGQERSLAAVETGRHKCHDDLSKSSEEKQVVKGAEHGLCKASALALMAPQRVGELLMPQQSPNGRHGSGGSRTGLTGGPGARQPSAVSDMCHSPEGGNAGSGGGGPDTRLPWDLDTTRSFDGRKGRIDGIAEREASRQIPDLSPDSAGSCQATVGASLGQDTEGTRLLLDSSTPCCVSGSVSSGELLGCQDLGPEAPASSGARSEVLGVGSSCCDMQPAVSDDPSLTTPHCKMSRSCEADAVPQVKDGGECLGGVQATPKKGSQSETASVSAALDRDTPSSDVDGSVVPHTTLCKEEVSGHTEGSVTSKGGSGRDGSLHMHCADLAMHATSKGREAVQISQEPSLSSSSTADKVDRNDPEKDCFINAKHLEGVKGQVSKPNKCAHAQENSRTASVEVDPRALHGTGPSQGNSQRRSGGAWRIYQPWRHKMTGRNAPWWVKELAPGSPTVPHINGLRQMKQVRAAIADGVIELRNINKFSRTIPKKQALRPKNLFPHSTAATLQHPAMGRRRIVETFAIDTPIAHRAVMLFKLHGRLCCSSWSLLLSHYNIKENQYYSMFLHLFASIRECECLHVPL